MLASEVRHLPEANRFEAVVDGCAARGHDLKIGEALYSDSLGRAGSPEGTWTGMLRHNAKSIANALGGRG
jgi:manganese/zinc/iron transport system substrate-binding protein